MDKKLETLHDLCEVISRELEDANEKIRKAGGKISAGDLEYIDKLTHSLKSIKTTIAMMEAEDEDGYSNRGYMPYYGSNSYAGRMHAKRDSMGRYSRRGGYSMDNKEMIEELRDLMNDAPDDRTRQEFQSFIDKMERM